MTGMKMQKTERIGMIALAIIVMLFAVLALCRGCGRGAGAVVEPDPELVQVADTAVCGAESADTVAQPIDTGSEKPKQTKNRRKKKKSTATRQTMPAPQRHHRSEPVSL